MSRQIGRRLFIVAALLATYFLFFVAMRTNFRYQLTFSPHIPTAIIDGCDSNDDKLEKTLKLSPKDNSIFFHETSCREKGSDRHLNPRQGCAVESAALMNPGREVYVLFSSHQNNSDNEIVQRLLEYPNVHLARLSLESYAAGTPLEEWVKTGQLARSKFLISHTSDVLRHLTMWKYGGVYLDLDVVVVKPLDELGVNWAGYESAGLAGSSILCFDRKITGRLYTDAALREISTNFRGDRWTHNGPALVDRVMRSICLDEQLPGINAETRCQGIKMYPPEYFYPIPYPDWQQYFLPSGMELLKQFEKTTYVYHIWNKLSSDRTLNPEEEVPYSYLAKRFCPKVYNVSKTNFFAFKH